MQVAHESIKTVICSDPVTQRMRSDRGFMMSCHDKGASHRPFISTRLAELASCPFASQSLTSTEPSATKGFQASGRTSAHTKHKRSAADNHLELAMQALRTLAPTKKKGAPFYTLDSCTHTAFQCLLCCDFYLQLRRPCCQLCVGRFTS